MQSTLTYFVRGSITVWLTSCFSCFAYVVSDTDLQVWLNLNQSNRRSAILLLTKSVSALCLMIIFNALLNEIIKI